MSDELERTNEVEITCTRDIEDITAEILEAKRAGGAVKSPGGSLSKP